MSTEIYLPCDVSSKAPSLLRQWLVWLGARRSTPRTLVTPFEPPATTSVLDKGRTQWIGQPLAREIRCTQGTLWLTFDGVRKDIILEAGQSYRCDCASRLAIHAIDTAHFEAHERALDVDRNTSASPPI